MSVRPVTAYSTEGQCLRAGREMKQVVGHKTVGLSIAAHLAVIIKWQLGKEAKKSRKNVDSVVRL